MIYAFFLFLNYKVMRCLKFTLSDQQNKVLLAIDNSQVLFELLFVNFKNTQMYLGHSTIYLSQFRVTVLKFNRKVTGVETLEWAMLMTSQWRKEEGKKYSMTSLFFLFFLTCIVQTLLIPSWN